MKGLILFSFLICFLCKSYLIDPIVFLVRFQHMQPCERMHMKCLKSITFWRQLIPGIITLAVFITEQLINAKYRRFRESTTQSGYLGWIDNHRTLIYVILLVCMFLLPLIHTIIQYLYHFTISNSEICYDLTFYRPDQIRYEIINDQTYVIYRRTRKNKWIELITIDTTCDNWYLIELKLRQSYKVM